MNDRLGKTAAGALVLLQTGFTAVGAVNGGLEAVALNHPVRLAIGVAVIALGLILSISGLLSDRLGGKSVGVGLVLLTLGVAGTIYASVVVPAQGSSPTINAEIVSTKPLVLRADVTATGIKRGTVFQIEVDGYIEPGGEYVPVKPLIYHAVLGADSAGEISSTFEIPVPRGAYEAVGIDAWSGAGKSPGACGYSLTHPGKLGFDPEEIPHFGCAIVHLPSGLALK